MISVLGQAFPKAFSRMIQLGLKGDAKHAYELHYKLMDLTALIFAENNPAGIKAVFNELGLCNATVRLPLVEASEDLKQKIKDAISNFKAHEALKK